MNSEVLRQLMTSPDAVERFYGVVVAIVTNNKDPENLHRVKVRFPWLDDANESHWARVASPMAGNGRGVYFLPEVDDEVLVAFEHGSIDFPYVVGSLWNGKDTPPESNSDGANNNRTIHSRSGHVIRFVDKNGSESIEIIDKTGMNRIVVSSQDNTITIASQSDIVIKSASGKLKMEAIGIEMTSRADVKIQANINVDVQANALMNMKASLIKLN
ncbi:MAG: phage tail protein [Blastocatellia bacterium]|nr:MAG: phage tail protein [Blastocatellia bacterium]